MQSNRNWHGVTFFYFILITPILFAMPGILLDTTGLMGHWTHVVHIAIFIPFIGLPAYFALPLFFIVGFAGIVIGIVIFKKESRRPDLNRGHADICGGGL